MMSGYGLGVGLDDPIALLPEPVSTSAAVNPAGSTTALPVYCCGFSIDTPAVNASLAWRRSGTAACVPR